MSRANVWAQRREGEALARIAQALEGFFAPRADGAPRRLENIDHSLGRESHGGEYLAFCSGTAREAASAGQWPGRITLEAAKPGSVGPEEGSPRATPFLYAYADGYL